MGKANAPKIRASNVSSATNSVSSSAILRSSFCPSQFQLALFASIIRGLDSEHLRIHDVHTGRLRCDHAVGSGSSVTCLDWGYYGKERRDVAFVEGGKKRKRSGHKDKQNANDNLTLAFGTSNSQIHFYSPTEAKFVGLLRDGHAHGVRDFKFVNGGLEGQAWSIGGDSKLVQWDLQKNIQVRTISLPNGSINTCQPFDNSIYYASHLVYHFELGSDKEPHKYNASTSPVRLIVLQPGQAPPARRVVTAAQNDRFLNVFQANSEPLVGTLCTESEVTHADLNIVPFESPVSGLDERLAERMSHPAHILAVINKDGVLELFPQPFDFGSDSDSMKARMKQRTRKSAAQIRITRAHKGLQVVPMIDLSLEGSFVRVAYAEGGVNVVFDTIKWRDEATGTLILNGNTEIIKEKGESGLDAVMPNGVKDMWRAHVDESHTIITNGLGNHEAPVEARVADVISISSGLESSDSSDDGADPIPHRSTNATSVPDLNEKTDADAEMEDVEGPAPTSDANVKSGTIEEPSFGEMLKANAPEPIDVAGSFSDPNQQNLVPVADRSLQQLPSGLSLGTVLTQSLRTNDRGLLQNCFHVTDLSIVRTTIERLDSAFAPTLLQRLAERLHSRPGRAGSLMVWIQWTLIAHGGSLAARPDVMKDLRSLQRVVKERANSLQSLLALKGKLDMLEAQMNIRKRMQTRVRGSGEEAEDAVVYVEGKDDSDSDLEEDEGASTDKTEDGRHQVRAGAGFHGLRPSQTPFADADGDSDSGDDMPMVNGHISDSADGENESEEEGMFDEEAASTDQDSGDGLSEEEVDHDDLDTGSSEGEGDASPSPEKRAISVTAGSGG